MIWIVSIEVFTNTILQNYLTLNASPIFSHLRLLQLQLQLRMPNVQNFVDHVNTWPHWIRCTYSIQCAADLGVSARVHRGKVTCGGNSHNVQWKQGVTPGIMTLACPLKPSVPPSTMGLIVAKSGEPSSSYSDNQHQQVSEQACSEQVCSSQMTQRKGTVSQYQ